MTPYQRAEAFERAFPDRVKHGARFVRGVTARGEESIYATLCGGQDYQNASPMYGAFPKGFLPGVLSLFPDARRILHLFSGSLTADQVEQAWRVSYTVFPALDVRPGRVGRADDGSVAVFPLPPTQLRFDSGRHPAAAAAKPDIVGDAENLAGLCEVIAAVTKPANRSWSKRESSALPREPFDLILADPPYRLPDQRRYWRESMFALKGNCRRCGEVADQHRPIYLKSTREGFLRCLGSGNPFTEVQIDDYVRFKPLKKKLVIQQAATVLAPGGWLVWLDEIRPPYDNTRWRFRGGICLVRSTNHRVRYATFLERR